MNYQKIAKEIRKKILTMTYLSKSSHVGSSLSCVDILTVLYFGSILAEVGKTNLIFKRIGVNKLITEIGSQQYFQEKNGLSCPKIKETIIRTLKSKN